MRKLLLGLLFALASFPAFGQNNTVVSTCGTLGQNYAVGSNRPGTVDPTGLGCVSASVSASITGFAPATYGTPLAVTTASSTGALPAGAVVIVNNVGTTNTAYCALGATATLSSQPIPPGGWFAYTVGGATQVSCITSASTTTVNTTGGAGIPTGAGGGGGGGSGGSVTQGTNPWIVAGQGSAGTSIGGVMTVQGAASMTPFLANPGTAANWGVGAVGSTIPANSILQGISVGGASRPQTGGALGSTFASHVALVDDTGTQVTSFAPGGSSANNLAGLIITAMTGTTPTALSGMGAQGGSLRVYVTACTFSNMSASVATEIVLTDGSGGSTLWTAPAAINGGGAHVTLPNPIRTTANTALFAANLTTGASTKVSCTGYKAL